MSKDSKVRLMPKGVYCCPKCDNRATVFVRVAEVTCSRHAEGRVVMSRRGS
jgi:hypothetical protein